VCAATLAEFGVTMDMFDNRVKYDSLYMPFRVCVLILRALTGSMLCPVPTDE
jgi:hypothetical protein